MQAATLGASIVYFQAHDEQGQPSQRREDYAAVIGPLRARCPDLLIAVATNVGRTLEERLAPLHLPGELKPDLAALTLGSFNAPSGVEVHEPETIRLLALEIQRAGVRPVWHVWDLGMAEYGAYLARAGVLKPPHMCTLMLGSLGTTGATPDNLSHLVNALPEGAMWSAAGIGQSQLAVVALAILFGGHVRIGLQDNPYLNAPGFVPATNAAQVQRACDIAHAVGRPIASPHSARQMIGALPRTADTLDAPVGPVIERAYAPASPSSSP